jgi:hypothetical protein
LGVGELSQVNTSPDFRAISSNRMVLATVAANAAHSKATLASGALILFRWTQCSPKTRDSTLCPRKPVTVGAMARWFEQLGVAHAALE